MTDSSRRSFVALKALNGPLAGSLYPVGDEVVFGRSRSCNVVLWDAKVSRTHAALQRTPDGFALVDLGSANGVSIGGERVQGGELKPGTQFGVGPYDFLLQEIDGPLELPELVPDAPIVGDLGEDTGTPIRFEGDLLASIVCYRNLRERVDAGEDLPTDDLEQLDFLQDRLAAAHRPEGERRSVFQRFSAKAMVTVRARADRSSRMLLGTLSDISVVGARVKFMTSPTSLGTGVPVELVVGTKPAGGSRHDVFWAQAVWRNGLEAGFCFRGHGRWGRFSAAAV